MTSLHIQRLNPETIFNSSRYGFSQIVIAPAQATIIHIAGQFSSNRDGGVEGDTVGEQARIAVQNLRLAIEAAGAGPEHVVKIQVLIVDHDERKWEAVAPHIAQLFGSHQPASTLIPVPRLALDGMLFEIDATLAVPL